MEILGYKYSTKSQAEVVVNQLNTYWGLPNNGYTTKFDITMFNNWGGGYWAREDEQWYLPVLGNPYIFEVPDPPTTI